MKTLYAMAPRPWWRAVLLLVLLLLARLAAQAQATGGSVGIGTTSPNASAALDISATDKGLLPPRLTETQRDAIQNPAAGLVIFNASANQLNVWDGQQWQQLVLGQAAPPTVFSTPGSYTYTVPTGTTSLQVKLAGAAGGDAQPPGIAGIVTMGGQGGIVQAQLSVVPGQVLRITVGGAGGSGTAGSNGGGQPNANTGGGGGASDIRRSGGALTDRLLVAGGGGGGSAGGRAGAARAQNSDAFGNGGNGGGLTGGTGGYEAFNPTYPRNPGTYAAVANGGAGGSQGSGGAGGAGVLNAGPDGSKGNLGTGAATVNAGGAGGGGYYGGGSGAGQYSAATYYASGGGGGGSSYADGSVTSAVTMQQGGQPGNGYVTLAPLAAPVLDGRNFLNVPGDNLGNHTATQPLNLQGNPVSGVASITTPSTGIHNMLAVAYGTIGATGTVFGSSDNYNLTVEGNGNYTIRFTAGGLAGLDVTRAVVVTSLYSSVQVSGTITWSGATGVLNIKTYDVTGAGADRGFSFVVYRP
jgi:hypothetical protein